MRRSLVALLAVGCAHAAPVAVPEVPANPPPPPRAALPPPLPALPAAASEEGGRIEGFLAASGLSYVTVEAGRMWMIGFASEKRPPVVVHVVRGDQYTMIMGRLGTVPPRASAEFYKALARRNFDVPQLKLGVDAHDGLYASFEVPTRLVDRDELLEDVFTLARTLDDVRAKLLVPEDPPERDKPLPRPPPPPDAPIIEARR